MPNFEQMPQPKEEEGKENATEVTKVGKIEKEETPEDSERISGFEETEPSIKVKKIISGLEATQVPKVEVEEEEMNVEALEKIKELLDGVDEIIEGEVIELGEEDIEEIKEGESIEGEVKEGAGENISDNVLNFLKGKLEKESEMKSIVEREFIFKDIFEKFREKSDKEVLEAFQGANLLTRSPEETEKSREDLAKELERIVSNYNVREIFDYLELGEKKGGTFSLE